MVERTSENRGEWKQAWHGILAKWKMNWYIEGLLKIPSFSSLLSCVHCLVERGPLPTEFRMSKQTKSHHIQEEMVWCFQNDVINIPFALNACEFIAMLHATAIPGSDYKFNRIWTTVCSIVFHVLANMNLISEIHLLGEWTIYFCRVTDVPSIRRHIPGLAEMLV